MKRYVFPYRREYSDLTGEICRPVVKIYLQAKNKKWRSFTLYADAGADIKRNNLYPALVSEIQ